MIRLIITLLRINWERIRYNAVLVITGIIRGTTTNKIYKEIGVEALLSRRKPNRLCTFHKKKTTGIPPYLFKGNYLFYRKLFNFYKES